MKRFALFRAMVITFCVVASVLFSVDSFACSCAPYDNQSLCQLGEEANSNGGRANFMAVVELGDSTISGEYITYPVTVLELLSGTLPSGDIELVQFGFGWSCTQYRYIKPRETGVLVGLVQDNQLYPTFCTLQESFFRMEADTVFVPLYGENYSPIIQPYTLSDFYNNDCVEVSNVAEVSPFDEVFVTSYVPQSQQLLVSPLYPSLLSEDLLLSIYASNGQLLIEAQPNSPIDLSSFPPGLYAILIRNERQTWSRKFVKPK